jgi:hypothetical protein
VSASTSDAPDRPSSDSDDVAGARDVLDGIIALDRADIRPSPNAAPSPNNNSVNPTSDPLLQATVLMADVLAVRTSAGCGDLVERRPPCEVRNRPATWTALWSAMVVAGTGDDDDQRRVGSSRTNREG